MARVPLVDPKTADGKTKDLFAAVEKAFGGVPNATRLMANSPAVLDAYLRFSSALADGLLAAGLQDQVKLATSESNACEYCVNALCAVGPGHGPTADELTGGRKGESADPKADAALKFAKRVVAEKGHVSEADVRAARAGGLSDGELVEVVAAVVHGFFTNYLNNAFKTDVDFAPAARLTA